MTDLFTEASTCKIFVMKTIAARLRDWVLEAVIIKQQELDWAYIDSGLSELTVYEDLSGPIAHLESLKNRYYQK